MEECGQEQSSCCLERGSPHLTAIASPRLQVYDIPAQFPKTDLSIPPSPSMGAAMRRTFGEYQGIEHVGVASDVCGWERTWRERSGSECLGDDRSVVRRVVAKFITNHILSRFQDLFMRIKFIDFGISKPISRVLDPS